MIRLLFLNLYKLYKTIKKLLTASNASLHYLHLKITHSVSVKTRSYAQKNKYNKRVIISNHS